MDIVEKSEKMVRHRITLTLVRSCTFLFSILLSVAAFAQDVTVPGPAGCNAAPMAGVFAVPCGVTNVTVEIYGGGGGAGGGGGGSNGGIFDTRGGGGGGGGAYVSFTANVTPGSSFSYSIGAGGCGGDGNGDGSSGDNGSAGGNTTISGTDADGNPVNLAANGGARGTGGSGTEGSPGSGGAGGTASGGATNTNGSTGNNGSGGTGGTGGAGAGPAGGPGGAADGGNGNPIGGGGGGGEDSDGGNGAPGAILITFNGGITLPPGPTITSAPPTCSTEGTSTIDAYDPNATYAFTPTGPTVGAGGLISGMVTGTSYTVTSELAGCVSDPSSSFSNDPPLNQLPEPVISTDPATCNADGISTITNYNALLTYTFDPVGPTAGAGGDISGMTAGTSYTVIANEGMNCVSPSSAPFSNDAQLPEPSITIAGELSYCEGENTTVTASGGTDYSWDHGPITAAVTVTQGTYTVTVTNVEGCSATEDVTITEVPSPVADFTFTTECQGTATTFTNTSTGTIAGSAWDFGAGPVLSTDATYTFPSAGTFPVTLGVSTAEGCLSLIAQQVTVNPSPVAAFSAPDVCLGDDTPFADGSSISAGTITYDWDFGDGSGTSAQTDPTYTYTAANSYDVVLTLTSDLNCTATATETVIVGVIPTTDFTVVDACDGDEVVFTDASSVSAGSITSWGWDFGDGNTSTVQSPTHAYGAPGVYDVTLIARSGVCEGTVTLQAETFETPVADFTVANACHGTALDFMDNSSITNGTITQWGWDFGGQGNAATQSPTFTFPNPGVFTVTLGIVSDNLCTASHSEDITVYPSPTAAFSATVVCLGEETEFDDESTVASGVVSNRSWNFGDGALSTATNPNHTYDSAGTYSVMLAVRTVFGCVDTLFQDVTVNGLPTITAGHSNILCAGQTNGQAFATASGTTPPYTLQWNDAQQQTTDTITGLNAGPYTVTVTDALGCVADTTVLVEQPLPINMNIVAGSDTCELGNGALQAVMLGGTAPFTYVWSAIRDSSHIYSEDVPPSGWNTGLSPGEYHVTVIDSGGCEVERTGTVGAIPSPEALFSTRSKPEEFNDPSVEFFNESLASVSYEWRFGDEEVGYQEHPVHDYDSAGTYLVMLIAYNEARFGCADTAFQYVEVEPLFTFYVPNAFTPDGDDINDTWGPAGDNFEYESYNVQVYDRWGKLVWQTDNPDWQWNGMDRDTGDPLKEGMYTYRFILKQFNTFEPKQITGSVMLYHNY